MKKLSRTLGSVLFSTLLATSCWTLAGDVQLDLMKNPGSTESASDAISNGWVTTVGVAPPAIGDIKGEGVKPPAETLQSLDQLGNVPPDEGQNEVHHKSGHKQ